MRVCLLAALALALAYVGTAEAGRYTSNVPLKTCPFDCSCENTICNFTDDDKVKCVGVQVICTRGRNARIAAAAAAAAADDTTNNTTDYYTTTPTTPTTPLTTTTTTATTNDSSTPSTIVSGIGAYQAKIHDGGIPSNVTGIMLKVYNFTTIDLNQFVLYEHLTDLMLGGNQIKNIYLTKILKNIKRLMLNDNMLVALPRRALGRLRSLNHLVLSNNQIASIRNIRFPRRLDMLDLRNNQIDALTGGLFKTNKYLRVIKLNDNRIKTIHNNAFRNTPRIEVLDLANNKLSHLSKMVFSKLLMTWYLSLRGNNIKDMHKLAFLYFGTKSHSRNQIDLRDNQIRFLSVEKLLPLLEHRESFQINFAGNPVFCDCNLLNLREEAGEMMTDTGHTVCEGPPENVKRLVLRLKFSDCCF